jgi:hypothetical protein
LSLCLTNLALHHEGVRGSGRIDPYLFYLCASLEVSGQFHAPAALPPGKEPPSTYWVGGWVDPTASMDNVENRKFLTLPGFELRPLGRPAGSQSLYRLRYPGSFCIITTDLKSFFYIISMKIRVLTVWRDEFPYVASPLNQSSAVFTSSSLRMRVPSKTASHV